MKFVKRIVRIVPVEEGQKQIDRIASKTLGKSINELIEEKNYSVTKHGTIYLKIPIYKENDSVAKFLIKHPRVEVVSDDNCHRLTVPYDVLLENKYEHALQYECIHDKYFIPRVTLSIRGSKDDMIELSNFCKFSISVVPLSNNMPMEFIIPDWAEGIANGSEYDESDIDIEPLVKTLITKDRQPEVMLLICNHVCVEKIYYQFNVLGKTDCTDILPGGLVTKLYMTGTIPQWNELIEHSDSPITSLIRRVLLNK